MSNTTNTAAASVEANNCTILPDGSAFAVASFPLPKDHWLYAPREYDVDAENPKELPSPILTHALRAEVVSAIRYAIRGATMCGKETDFDPDALVQNAVYALCGPYGSAALAAPADADVERRAQLWSEHVAKLDALVTYCPTCCQGFTANREMARDEVIFECGKSAGRSSAKQESLDADQALKKAGAIAISAVKTNSRDIADWRDDMDRIAAIAAQRGGEHG